MGKATNKLAVWGQTGDYDGSDYSITSGETQGFQSGSLVIAQSVNKALRNASIFEYALAETLASFTSEAITNFDIGVGVSDISTFSANVQTAIDAYIAHIKVSEASSADAATNVTTNINGKAISSIFETNGTTAKNATNVTTKINGKNISSIFETNGTTVKNASDAANVTETINSHAITDIFETNGTTVKEATHATKATQDESGNNIKTTYAANLQLKANTTDTLQLINKNSQLIREVTISKVNAAIESDKFSTAKYGKIRNKDHDEIGSGYTNFSDGSPLLIDLESNINFGTNSSITATIINATSIGASTITATTGFVGDLNGKAKDLEGFNSEWSVASYINSGYRFDLSINLERNHTYEFVLVQYSLTSGALKPHYCNLGLISIPNLNVIADYLNPLGYFKLTGKINETMYVLNCEIDSNRISLRYIKISSTDLGEFGEELPVIPQGQGMALLYRKIR